LRAFLFLHPVASKFACRIANAVSIRFLSDFDLDARHPKSDESPRFEQRKAGGDGI
jgi:hypothetical protein